MRYYCENCGYMSDFGDFCLNCESPNMISAFQLKKNPNAGNCRGIANRFELNDRRLAKNVAANHGDNPEKTKFTQDSAKTMYEALKIVCEDCEKWIESREMKIFAFDFDGTLVRAILAA